MVGRRDDGHPHLDVRQGRYDNHVTICKIAGSAPGKRYERHKGAGCMMVLKGEGPRNKAGMVSSFSLTRQALSPSTGGIEERMPASRAYEWDSGEMIITTDHEDNTESCMNGHELKDVGSLPGRKWQTVP